MSTLSKVQQVLRSEGWGGLLRRSVQKCLIAIIQVERFYFFETDLANTPPIVTARVPLEIRPASPKDFETYAGTLEEIGITRREVQRALEHGDTAILTLSGPDLVHFMWVRFSSIWIPEIDSTLVLNPGEAYTYNAVTVPRWRRFGIHTASHCYANQYERTSGYTRHINFVSSDNVPALKVMARLQRKRTKTVWSIRVLGLKHPLIVGATRKGSPSLARPS